MSSALFSRASGDIRSDFRDRDRDRDRERDFERDRRGQHSNDRPFGPRDGPGGNHFGPHYGRGPPPAFRGGPGPGGPPFRGDMGFRRSGDMGFRGSGDAFGPPPPGPSYPPAPAAEAFVVDREKVCPLLIRVFIKPGSHHRLEDFAIRGKEPGGDAEIQIYTWMDATLREMSDLIKEVKLAARGRMTRLSFAFVYPDKRGRNVMRQVGLVHSTRPGEDDNKTLKALNFQTGDFLDVAIL